MSETRGGSRYEILIWIWHDLIIWASRNGLEMVVLQDRGSMLYQS